MSETDISNIHSMNSSNWSSINPEYVKRMRVQNQFKSGIDIAKYTASIMRRDMDDYDGDTSKYTQSLGCWHGFIGQQKLISIKKHFGNTDKKYLYLSGWMVAALRSDFGPLPDQSMHEKTTVASLIDELYTFLKQADARELGGLFRELDSAESSAKEEIQNKIDNPYDIEKIILVLRSHDENLILDYMGFSETTFNIQIRTYNSNSFYDMLDELSEIVYDDVKGYKA